MNYLTRYYLKLNQIFKVVNKKSKKLKKNFLSFLIFLFFGFFFGNLFGTLMDSIRKFNIPDTLLIFILIIFNEFINFIIYHNGKKKINSTFREKIYNFLNAFKIGALLGFFIDSFKVGS